MNPWNHEDRALEGISFPQGGAKMAGNNLLEGLRILVVDDEPDILQTLEQLLDMCLVVKASTFEQAKERIEGEYFDMAILDIAGVDGYKLLEIANKHDIIAVMLTANALSPDNVVKSFEEGAAYYVPKEEMVNIVTYLNDVLEARAKGKSLWSRWMYRFGSFFEKKFGPKWRESDKEVWEKFSRFDH
jgi:CheY-like chemotaxis protein